jgi:glyoxylase-like metal-dependent hydrolase (beta-lactamase superfamily II)
MEMRPGIHRVEWSLVGRPAYSYLFVGERVLLIDSGLASTPEESLLPYMSSHGIDPERVEFVLSTHSDMDHTGGNAAATALFPRALLMCHELDRPMVEDLERLVVGRYEEFLPDHGVVDPPETLEWYRTNARHAPVGLALSGGEVLRLSKDWTVELVHTPGHTRGSISVWDAAHGVAVIGDAVLGVAVPGNNGPAMPPTYRYVDAYEATIRALQTRSPEVLLTAHYPVMGETETQDFLAMSLGYCQQVEAVLVKELGSAPGAITLAELIERLGPGLGAWPEASSYLLAFPFVGHLERLVATGRALARRVDGRMAWEMAT